MKHLFSLALLSLLAVPAANAQVYGRGFYGRGPVYSGYRGSEYRHSGWSVGLSFGFPAYAYSYPYSYPAYGYSAAGRSYDDYGYGSADYRSSGTFLGALAGAVIGNNSGSLHHSAGLGALWGAGVGYVLGSVADADAHRQVVAVETTNDGWRATSGTIPVSPAPLAPLPMSLAPVSDAGPMAGVNGMFGR